MNLKLLHLHLYFSACTRCLEQYIHAVGFEATLQQVLLVMYLE